MVCRRRGIGDTLEWHRKPLHGSNIRRWLFSVSLVKHWADMANVVTKLLPNDPHQRSNYAG